MEHVLLVIHVIIAASLIGMVLLQRSDTDGFGLGSGGGSGLLSGRAQANLLTRTTAILAALFIANSLLLSVLASNHRAPSIVDTIEQEQAKETFGGAPAVPTAGEDKSAKKAAEKVSVPEVKDVSEKAVAPKPAKAKKAKPANDEDGENPSE